MIVGSRQSAVGSDSAINGTPLLSSEYAIIDPVLTTADCRLPTERGVILIALLWILTALSFIALSFSRESFVEVAAARNAQSLEDSYFVARAGIETTIYQMIQKRMMPRIRRAAGQSAPDPIDLGVVTGTLNGGTYQVNIQDESGKISLNVVSEQQLRRLVEAIGIGKEDGDIIVDSILDWKDPDKSYRLNGAEDDYYATLNPPYKAKNAIFDTVEELLLVRGVTPEYFYGYPERTSDGSIVYRYGLSRCLTTYSEKNQINVNFAPLPVLMSVQGISPEAAQMIYERRRANPFNTTADISRELPGSPGAVALSYLTTQQTGIYTLLASAHASRSKAKRVIRAVINLDQTGENAPYQTLYWNENVPDYEGLKP
ncbi:MAG: general secretion pathway protein GspK [Acidobacteria bacterium]|nr:general secretion pathway protein GspK [Acidobacteriota bacterium]